MVTFPSFLPRPRALPTAIAAALPSPSATPRHAKFTKFGSGLDFQDATELPYSTSGAPASFSVPLTPPPSHLEAVARGTTSSPSLARSGSVAGRGSEKGEDGVRRNVGQQGRLQGLMRSNTAASRRSGRGEVGDVQLRRWDKFKAWMVNEGSGKFTFALFVLVQVAVFTFGFLNYAMKGELFPRRNYGVTYEIARAAALVLHVDVAFILLPVCRTFISMLRRTPLNRIVPFEHNLDFHMAVAWSIVFFTVVHIVAHLFNAWWMGEMASSSVGGRFVVFLEVNFTTGPGITGWIMTICLAIIVWFAIEKRRRKRFEAFYFSHHLFIPFFIAWQLHGMFCLIKPDRPPFCDYEQIGVFWKYWLVGGLIYIAERLAREVRSRHRTWIHKVVLHPSNVVEVQIKKERCKTRAGQYIFVNVPSISYFQFHPFTLTSAPEEDYISIHVRIVGDWTRSFAEALGCQLPPRGAQPSKAVGAEVIQLQVGRVLPRIMIDGPFGSASEDVLKYEVSVLVGAGIGVTPFASILKHIWYRTTYPTGEKMALRKVYFFWVCRDYESFEWFQALLSALEEQDFTNHLEIHVYVSGRIQENDMHNIIANDVGGDHDAVTRLRAPTHYGRPDWDRIFDTLATSHPETDVGVFFCGPKPLGAMLHKMCNKYTSGKSGGTSFFFGKENF
ncbi:hypothetical protein JCM8097_004630 [Rhodosporidiobolus ruineniae]